MHCVGGSTTEDSVFEADRLVKGNGDSILNSLFFCCFNFTSANTQQPITRYLGSNNNVKLQIVVRVGIELQEHLIGNCIGTSASRITTREEGSGETAVAGAT